MNRPYKISAFIFLIFFGLNLLVTSKSFANECTWDRVRFEMEQDQFIFIGNLDHRVAISKRSLESNPNLKSLIERSRRDRSFFFDIDVDRSSCNFVKRTNRWRVFQINANSFDVLGQSSQRNRDCVECISLTNPPILFELPNLPGLEEIFAGVLGIDYEKADNFRWRIVDILERMDPAKLNANSLAFPIILFYELHELGLNQITGQQLEFIASLFEGEVSSSEIEFLQLLANDVETLSFERNRRNKLEVKINFLNRSAMQITSDDIPIDDPAQRQMIEDHLQEVTIDHGARIIYDSYDSEKLTAQVELNGIEVVGRVPLVGRIRVSPENLDVDLNDISPAKIRIRFRKVISVRRTFDIDY